MSTVMERSRLEALPMVDFAPFFAGRRKEVAREIGHACGTIGFFYLKNHGVDQRKRDNAFMAARRFFDAPMAVKMDEAIRAKPGSPRGYVPMFGHKDPKEKYADQMEMLRTELELPADDPDIVAGNRLHTLNKWPPSMPELRQAAGAYYDEMLKLSHCLLRAFALALDLPEEQFLGAYRKPLSQMNLVHYPPQKPMAPDNVHSLRPHADGDAFTILANDDVGGLQVLAGRERWIEVPPIPGAFIINIGDVMAMWTNDRFPSTMHRVINSSGKERYSVPFFAMPDYDAVIECLPTCCGPGDPPKHAPFVMGEYVQSRLSKELDHKNH